MERDSNTLRARFVQYLGEARYGRESGLVGELNLLARMGLPLPEGVVLTHESHRQFLETSGLLQSIQAAVPELKDARRRALEAQLKLSSTPIEGELNRAICDALIELGASAVVVLSEDLMESGLGSIPEVQAAIRRAWLSLEGLKQQFEAATRDEDLPTWPVLLQRELQPEYTAWSVTESLTGEGLIAGRFGKGNEALSDLRPTGGAPYPTQNSIAYLTFNTLERFWYCLSLIPHLPQFVLRLVGTKKDQGSNTTLLDQC